MIGEQKWKVILEMPWLTYYNSEINWRMEEVKMMRCSEECRKQWRLKQEKSGWEKMEREKIEEERRKEKEEKAEKKE